MIFNPHIFRNCDIRGVTDIDLSAPIMNGLGKAYGTLMRKKGVTQIVCGRDCRQSGLAYQKAFIQGVLSMGIDVIDIGMVMTQMMYFAQYHFRTIGGAMLTASHNPKNYNGLKLATGYSQTTGPEDLIEIQEILSDERFSLANQKGSLSETSLTMEYSDYLLKSLKSELRYKVVVDGHCGTTGLFNPDILRRAGCEVIEVNSEPDGSFPKGTPDPTDSRLMNELAELVLKHKADLGFAFDGDGDRMGLVDDKGHVLWNDVVVAIFAIDVLSRLPGSKIVFNTLCSQVVSEVINQHGGIPVIWKTGHTFIKEKMKQEKASFGGELSGHFFFTDDSYGFDDGTMAALRLLQTVFDSGPSLSKLYESFPHFVSSPEIKIGCPDDKKVEVIKTLSSVFKADFPSARIIDSSVILDDDGVRADFDDGMIIFRYSQNGPYITVKFEAKDQEMFEVRRRYVRDMLKRFPEMVWEDELCVNLDFLI